MPVIREERRVTSTGAVGGQQGDAGSREFMRTAAVIADTAAGMGAQFGQMLKEENERKALALAEQAAITMDENGIPHVDQSNRDTLSYNAARVFDQTIRKRYEQRVVVSLEEKLREIHAQHPADPDGFRVEAAATVEGFLGGLPVEMQGFARDAAHTLSARLGAQVGYEKGQLDQRNAKADFDVAVSRAESDIERLIMAGQPDEASALMASIMEQGAALQQTGAIDGADLERSRVAMEAQLGMSIFMKKGEDEGWGADEWGDLHRRLIAGNDAELNALFPNARVRAQAANRAIQLGSLAAHEERLEQERLEELANRQRVSNGGGSPGNRKDGMALDVELGEKIGLPSLGVDTWLDERMTQEDVWFGIRRSRIVPPSLKAAFTQFSTADADAQENLLWAWRQLQDGAGPSGLTVDLSDQLPQETQQMLMLVDMWVEAGHSMEFATRRADTIITDGFDDRRLYRAAREGTSGWFTSSPFESPETLDDDMADILRTSLENDIDATMRDRDVNRAVVFMKTLMSGGVSYEDAYDRVRNSTERQHPETQWMVGGPGFSKQGRSAFAPEAIYAVPDDPGWFGRNFSGETPWFDQWAEKSIRRGLGGEFGNPLDAIREMRDALSPEELEQFGEMNREMQVAIQNGDDRVLRGFLKEAGIDPKTFDANDAEQYYEELPLRLFFARNGKKDEIAKIPTLGSEARAAREFRLDADDIGLFQVGGDKTRPVYEVFRRNDFGDFDPLLGPDGQRIVIDPRPAHQAKLDQLADADREVMERERASRALTRIENRLTGPEKVSLYRTVQRWFESGGAAKKTRDEVLVQWLIDNGKKDQIPDFILEQIGPQGPSAPPPPQFTGTDR